MKSTYIKSTYVNQPITVENKVASIDSSYGPYKTIQEALNSIPYKYRALGRTVAIIEDNEVKEYQWKSGIEDSDLVEKYSGGGSTEPITWDTLGGKPTIIASGETPAEARTAIGAGTSDLEIGTTSTTAMAGDTPLLTIGTTASTAKAGNYVPTWAEVTDKPATFAPTIGTSATTAKAGNYQPTWAQVTDKPTTFTPSAHTHPWADITDKPALFSGDYNDLTNKPTIPTFVESVENQNTTQPNIMFWTGTQAEYDLITVPNPDTIYYIKS